MTKSDQQHKAQALLSHHSSGRMLVLPNIWDPLGARILADKGFPAVATASAAVSASLGFRDGERLTRDTMLEVVRRICRAVDVPVTADLESGYADSLDDLEETTRALIETGAVGMNLEDGLADGGPLRRLDEQTERIAKVRDVATGQGIHLVINARVDCFLSDRYPANDARIEETVSRARAYMEAGADCIYPIGPGDVETLTILRSRITTPLNALVTPHAAPFEAMETIGINRLSFGPFIFRSCLKKFADIAAALADHESYDCFGREMMSAADVSGYLNTNREVR